MLDFTSALYLGFRHAHDALPPWTQLTTGRPAALEPAPEAVVLAQDLAQLLGCERAVLVPSTLHLFWDLFDVLAHDRIAIYVDAGTYPIARYGVERAAAKGVPTSTFPGHDPAALASLLQRDRATGRRPVVVTDGLCTATGRTAPLADYLKLIRGWNGYLVVDDTQAFGILGANPAPAAPYGRGGAGTPACRALTGPGLIIGSSLAKGFGAPLAVLAGSAEVIAKFEGLSGTRVLSSPPLSRSSARRSARSPSTRGKATIFATAWQISCGISARGYVRSGSARVAVCFRFRRCTSFRASIHSRCTAVCSVLVSEPS